MIFFYLTFHIVLIFQCKGAIVKFMCSGVLIV